MTDKDIISKIELLQKTKELVRQLEQEVVDMLNSKLQGE
jgi:hypothetical protein